MDEKSKENSSISTAHLEANGYSQQEIAAIMVDQSVSFASAKLYLNADSRCRESSRVCRHD